MPPAGPERHYGSPGPQTDPLYRCRRLTKADERLDDHGRTKLLGLLDAGDPRGCGGNLSLATTLRAKRDGILGAIDGVYAMCPYISGAYASPPPELASLQEHDGYFLECRTMGAMVKAYDPTGQHATDPLAWPYHASVDDLRGLPPHVISVNQLDPLRNEGLAYARRLLEAGASVVSRTVNGTCHAGDLIFGGALADVPRCDDPRRRRLLQVPHP